MKISVAYDSRGKILAAFAMEPRCPFQVRVEGENALSAVIEVPAEFHGKNLHEFLPNVTVDVATCQLIRK